MKDIDWGLALFSGFCAGGFAFLAYLLGHDDGWFFGNEERLKSISEALETASEFEKNK